MIIALILSILPSSSLPSAGQSHQYMASVEVGLTQRFLKGRKRFESDAQSSYCVESVW